MSKIFLVNVGANCGHRALARSPIFPDGSFEFVTFPDGNGDTAYPKELRRYVRGVATTHLDPDWKRRTYGDCCLNPRARALQNAVKGDILLFWALLWKVNDRDSDIWISDDRCWCLIGALRIQYILEAGQGIKCLPPADAIRAAQNHHVLGKFVDSGEGTRVFLGHPRYSARFKMAVDLGIYRSDSLLRKVVYSKDGRMLQWHESPRWNSATRSCRAILDLNDDRPRAEILRNAILRANSDFDLLETL